MVSTDEIYYGEEGVWLVLRYALYLLTLLTSLVMLVMMVLTGRQIRKNTRARLYFVFLLAAFFYAFSQSQQFVSSDSIRLLVWIKLEAVGFPFIGPSLVLLAYHTRYLREDQRIPKWLLALYLPSLVVNASVLFFPAVKLYYTNIDVISLGEDFFLVTHGNFLRDLHMVLTSVEVGISLYFYAMAARNSRGDGRDAIYLTLLGIVIPGLVFFLYALGIFPEGVDPIPMAMGLSSPFYASSLYSERLLSDIGFAKLNYFHISANPVFVFGKDRKCIDLNPAASTAFGIKREDAMHRTWIELLEQQENSNILMHENDVGMGKELVIRNKVYSYSSTIFRDTRGYIRGLIRTLYDVTELQRAVHILEQEASVDTLTGILTRRRWEQSVEKTLLQAARFGHPGTLMILDLDHFKRVNDNYGHQVGDTVLREISGRLRASLRNVDHIGRYGGEELVVWLTETGESDAHIVAEKILRIINSRPVLAGSDSINVTTSIGLFGCEKIERSDLHYYVKHADAALYQAKQQGRNRVVVSLHS